MLLHCLMKCEELDLQISFVPCYVTSSHIDFCLCVFGRSFFTNEYMLSHCEVQTILVCIVNSYLESINPRSKLHYQTDYHAEFVILEEVSGTNRYCYELLRWEVQSIFLFKNQEQGLFLTSPSALCSALVFGLANLVYWI